MKLSDLEQLLDSRPIEKAPQDFTANVMSAIRSVEIKKTPSPHKNYQMGMRLLAAGLIALLINFSPLINTILEETGQYRQHHETLQFEQVSETIDYYTLKASNLLVKPYRFITASINKEE